MAKPGDITATVDPALRPRLELAKAYMRMSWGELLVSGVEALAHEGKLPEDFTHAGKP